MVGGLLTILISTPSISGVVLAFQFGILFFLLSTISDLVTRQAFTRYDRIYNTRRCAGLSMFSNLLWFGFLLFGSVLVRFFSYWSLWFDLLWIGFAAICILRSVVFLSTSLLSYWRKIISALLQPIICLTSLFYVPYSLGRLTDGFSIAPLFLSIPISVVTAFLFINSVDKVGIKTLKIATTSILKPFLANWMEDLNAPLENLFESFGSKRTIDFSILAFNVNSSLKSLIVVPSFHPGPFKNVGSSSLPFIIQEELEKKMGCLTAVPHGLFGHEFDLSSQQQNRKVLKSVLESTDFPSFKKEATRLVRVRKGNASASCQIFGKCALISLTMAPETTEDFPREIGDSIINEALELGLSHVVIVNAHNSINGSFDVSKVTETLKEVSSEALRKASHMKPTLFKIGVAKSVLTEFSLEEGMGPGGIHVLLVKTGEDTCVYITIDGNNMISGLREKILETLKDFDIDDGEVFTTDTHAVNAIVMTARGYHPIGEVMAHDILIRHISENVKEALSNMESASFSWRAGAVANVGVIGEEQIRKITLLADKALKRAKLISFPLFGVAGLVLVLLNILV